MPEALYELSGVAKSYPARGKAAAVNALRGIDLTIDEGEFLVLRGPSGCGKSTLLLALGGMLRPNAGRLAYQGAQLYERSQADRSRLRAEAIGFVFQSMDLLPYLDVLQNVLSGALSAAARSDARPRALALLDELGLSERLTHRPAELSIGERQRVAVARALIGRPQIILADEPTGNLDPASAAGVLEQLKSYQSAGGTVVLVTHAANLSVEPMRELRMESGRLV